MTENQPTTDWPSLRTFHQSEQGMIAWGVIFVVLLMLVAFALVANAINTVNRKIETQNTADAVAYSSAVWQARGMNSVTATNHIVGELNAIYALHHAFGGKYLDNHRQDKKPNSTPEFDRLNSQITGTITIGKGAILSKRFLFVKIKFPPRKIEIKGGWSFIKGWCQTIKPVDEHKDRISEDPVADVHSTLYEAKRELKKQYRDELIMHLIGATIEKGEVVPIVGPLFKVAGLLIQGIAYAAEWKTYIEYLVLDGVEIVARNSSPMKAAIPKVISAIYLYQQAEVIARTPLQSYRSADKVAKLNHVEAEGFVRADLPDKIPTSVGGVLEEVSKLYPKLPIEKEVTDDGHKNQLLRASYPWVSFWRKSITKFLAIHKFEIRIPWPISKTLGLYSYSADYYRKWTNIYSRQSTEWLMTNKESKYAQMLTVENYVAKGGFFGGGIFGGGMFGGDQPEGEKGKQIGLYVMQDLNEPRNRYGQSTASRDKSQEPWNEPSLKASLRADELFCLVGFAKMPKPTIISSQIFRQENPHGFLGYSQAMVYNANPQQRPANWNGIGASQPEVGWDTLNWSDEASATGPAIEWQFTNKDRDFSRDRGWYNYPLPEVVKNVWPRGGRNADSHKPPGIKLNWQAKLTPLTYAKMIKVLSTEALASSLSGDEDVKKILLNNREGQIYLQNH